MLVSPRYRAISTRGRFDALYGVTDPTVQFRDTFTAQFDVADLLGEPSLGCGIGGPQPNINWDVVVTISERYTDRRWSGGRRRAAERRHAHQQWLHQSDLGLGLALVDLCVWPPACAELITTTSGTVSGYPDAIFGHLLASLGTDLGNTQTKYLCANADGGTSAPVSPSSCSQLQSAWAAVTTKLDRCLEAAETPKNSAFSQNCQSFETQFLSYKNTLASVPRQGSDPANRIGEVEARAQVLEHVYRDHFSAGGPVVPSRSRLGVVPGRALCFPGAGGARAPHTASCV